MNLVADLEARHIPWKYLPLEDDRKAWGWRYLAIMAGDYALTAKDQEGAAYRQSVMTQYQPELDAALSRVAENPRAGVKNKAGETVIPPVDYRAVVAWVREAIKTARVVVVDPFAQVDFDHKKLLQEHDAMIRDLLGLVAGENCTLVLVAHVGRDKAGMATSADSMQGSINLTRLAHTTLILEAHDPKDSYMHRPDGEPSELLEHNRRILIAATRNGSGNGKIVAFNADPDKPWFHEVGVIDKKMTEALEKKRNKEKAK
jgi:hypothetical protein